ncbi:MAG: DNA polymerase III subunit delta [Dehalococcoidia bacterium]
MLHVLYGSDEFRASEALRALRDSLDEDGSLATNTTTVPGRGVTPQQLIAHASALPFLAPARLVIVEGLLSTLGSRRGLVDEWQPFLDFLPQMPETNHVVLLERPPKDDRQRDVVARSSLLKALTQRPNVTSTQFDLLRTYARGGPSEVAQWLQDRAVRRGISIAPPAIEALAELAGAHLRTLASELDKLAAYAAGRTITAEDVHLLTPHSREERIFDVTDAIVAGQAGVALKTLQRMLAEGTESAAFVQLMVARQVRLLVRATDLVEAHASQDEIAAATKTRGYPLTKLMQQARATHRGAAEAALRVLEETDHAVKTGKYSLSGRDSDALALELLVVRLAALAPRRGRR